MTITFSVGVSIFFVAFILSVDGEVRQVHEDVLQIIGLGRLVRLRGEPGHPLVEQVYFHGINPVEQNVYSQVEFQTVY